MKKLMIMFSVAVICVSSAFPAIAGCRWNEDEGIAAEWDKYSCKTKIELYKGSTDYEVNKVSSATVAADKETRNFTQAILDNGPGTYTYVIRTTDGSYLDSSEEMQIGDDYYLQLVLGHVAPTWQLSNGKWYLIDPVGNKLMGWHKVNEKWYYMNETSGVCYINRMTPDGYFVDENGEWDGKPSVYQ